MVKRAVSFCDECESTADVQLVRLGAAAGPVEKAELCADCRQKPFAVLLANAQARTANAARPIQATLRRSTLDDVAAARKAARAAGRGEIPTPPRTGRRAPRTPS